MLVWWLLDNRLNLPLTPLLGSTELLNELLGGGEVEGAEDIAQVEGVNGVATLEVVDAERELCACT